MSPQPTIITLPQPSPLSLCRLLKVVIPEVILTKKMLECSYLGRHSFKERTHKIIKRNIHLSTSESSCFSSRGMRGKVRDASWRASKVNQDSRGVGSGQWGGEETGADCGKWETWWGRRSRSVGGEAGKQGERGGQEDFGERLASWHIYSSCCCVSLGE